MGVERAEAGAVSLRAGLEVAVGGAADLCLGDFQGPEEAGQVHHSRLKGLEGATLFDVVQGASIDGKTMEGWRVSMIGEPREGWESPDEKPYCVISGDGWSLQAGVRIRAADRVGLERLCGYVLRPALAADRLKVLPDGKIAYGFRKPRFDGATHVVLTPMEFVAKVAVLAAPPRSHLVCYDGVLAAHARARRKVTGDAEPPARHGHLKRPEVESTESPAKRRTKTRWADLMARWLGMDVMLCPKCGSRMGMLALITNKAVAGRMLVAMGLSDAEPELRRPRPPPDEGFEFDQASYAE